MKIALQVLGPICIIAAAFMFALPWMIVGFDRYAHWVSTFR